MASKNTYHSGMINSKGYMNSMYSSGESHMNPINQMNLPYVFKERSGKLKWKEVMRVDLDSMIRNNDISPLENYLENLIFSSIDETDLQMVPDSSFVKLVKINQYIMEFLLDTQQRLENDNRILESNYSGLLNDAAQKEIQLKQNKSLLNALKKDKKEKEAVLNTYKCLIDEYKSGKLNESSTSRKYFYCKHCGGKRFSSEEKLEAHMQRRHCLDEDSFKKESKFDDKLEQMKTYFETYIKNFQSDSYIKIFENQKNLENKLTEIKYEKGHDLKDIENHFKTTLVEMKELYLRNSVSNNNFGQSYLNSIEKRRESDDEGEVAKKLKKETQKMNEMLKEISREQSEKMQGLAEQFSQFKSKISDEFKEIKEFKEKSSSKLTSEVEPEQDLNKNSLRRNRVSYEKKLSPRQVSHAESIQLNSEKKFNFIKDSTAQASIQKTKLVFNAGPLESDSESDLVEMKMKNMSVSISQNENRTQEDVKFSFAPDKVKVSVKEEAKVEMVKNVSVTGPLTNNSQMEGNMEVNISKNSLNKSLSPEDFSNVKPKTPIQTLQKIEPIVPEKEIIKLTRVNKEEINKTSSTTNDNSTKENLTIARNKQSEQDDLVNTEIKEVPKIKEVELKRDDSKIQMEKPSAVVPEAVENLQDEQTKREEALENFFHKFYERDNEALAGANSKILFKDVLKSKNDLETLDLEKIPDGNETISRKLGSKLNETTKRHSRGRSGNVSFDNIQTAPNEEILGIFDSILGNLKVLSTNNEFFKEYYQNISDSNGLEDCKKFVDDKRKDRNYLPLNNLSPRKNQGKVSALTKEDAIITTEENKNPVFGKSTFGGKEEAINLTKIDDGQFSYDD